ncbi:hypothetical protein ILFOPFJJ_07010 [Ensifer psoraleae]|nr:hypothetical protein [Sinorhizobium psoraleae]
MARRRKLLWPTAGFLQRVMLRSGVADPHPLHQYRVFGIRSGNTALEPHRFGARLRFSEMRQYETDLLITIGVYLIALDIFIQSLAGKPNSNALFAVLTQVVTETAKNMRVRSGCRCFVFILFNQRGVLGIRPQLWVTYDRHGAPRRLRCPEMSYCLSESREVLGITVSDELARIIGQ